MKNIGLYFGSFNPIHNGHLIVAQYMYNTGLFDAIRFVVSPQNPFKNNVDLLDSKLRLEMVQKAIKGNAAFEISDVEFHLPIPGYTIDTVEYLTDNEPDVVFSIIMGSDNIAQLNTWKDIERLSTLCEFHIYNRRGSENNSPSFPIKYHLHSAPFLDISATYIRQLLADNKSVKYLIPDAIIPLL